ncbi:MAG: hypothetical protein Q8L65_17415 [Burkholderiales bacterium]|nr:hypothetical protein [Burkholderiales bacterium]MDP2399632.1 hypothetical protein [Burkholderiales bacterium]
MSTKHLRKFTLPVAAAAVLAVSSAAFAGTTVSTTPQQSAEKPVDCKKTPDHERCKDKK